ncbi:P-loop containing nucleoside triphosphate hydrolase protein, partial [Mycena epipterygia]
MKHYFNTNLGRRHVLLLYGLGGAGKSQIAFKFVETSTVPEPRFCDIYFIDSSTRQTIENDLATLALAKQIGKTARDSLLWLSHQQREWLIVFDNADDIHLNLREFFPSGSHGNILITSRNPALGQHAQTECKIDCMELEDAINLLLAAAGCDSADLSKSLFKKLYCFPLAVAQAGGSISSLHALHHYLELYEDTAKRIQQLNRRPVQSEYEWSVYTTWQISFEKLSIPAAKLLQLCSFIHHDAISEDMFKRAALYKHTPKYSNLQESLSFLASFMDSRSNWDLQKFLDVTTELRHYSLIELGAVSKDFTFSIHPLVHEWCRTTVSSDASTEVCMHKLVGMSLSSTSFDLLFHLKLCPHVDALLFPRKGVGFQLGPNALDMPFAQEFLWVYVDMGKWSEGEQLAKSMLKIRSEREIPEREILIIRAALGVMYTGLGRFNDAKEVEKLVLERLVELFGEDDSDTLIAMANLARTYSNLGHFKRAQELEITVFNKRRDSLGEHHPDTLMAMATLAITYSQLGQFRVAEELEQTVLKKRKDIFGKDHPDILSALENLAISYSQLGKFRQAEELEQIVLKKRKEILSEYHPDILRTMENLGFRYSELGQFRHAEELITIFLVKHTEILGRDHASTLHS